MPPPNSSGLLRVASELNIAMKDDADFGAYRPGPAASAIIAVCRFLSRTPVLSTRRFFRFLLGLASDGPFDVTALGVRMRSHPWDNRSDSKLLLTPLHCSPRELEVLRRALAMGGNFVDIGANIGAFTLQAARLDHVSVLAVEPNPIAVDRLRANVTVNEFENVSIVETVLGKSAGDTSFTFVLDDIGKSGIGTRAGKGKRDVRRVPMRTLADVLAEHEIESIAALKIDVEGHEDDVLIPFFESAIRGQWPRLLIMEDNRPRPLGVLSVLHDHGYVEILRTKANVALSLPAGDRESES